ncbi:HipA domain-containing protein [Schaalia suimastitidis]|uniref:HipA domain-containing protein n=1 Tax=Schaalia suimastitidis TaxID=121163 RepID=UPI0004267528|nr:HipA domain-containing protein [Schaalia suimastitidis]
MSEVLNVFRNGLHVGCFTKNGDDISFAYTKDATHPISLSLPIDGTFGHNAPGRYLDNLLPDDLRVRRSWARQLGSAADPFTLLSHMGEDIAGALVLSPEATLERLHQPVVRVDDDALASRVATISHESTEWLECAQIGTYRMSLAGAQGKFTLRRMGDAWFWPSATLASTHIFKPEPQHLPGLAALEAGALTLARAVGIKAPHAYVETIAGYPTFIVQRFDRANGAEQVRRVHTEDLLQAMGRPAHAKYDLGAIPVLTFIRKTLGQSQAMEFIRMLAFNVSIGNADAHAKNYSLMLDDDPRLAPLYDAVPTMLWSQFTTRLAMRIGSASHAYAVTRRDWMHLADRVSLPVDEVVEIATRTAQGVRHHAQEAWSWPDIPDSTRSRLLGIIDRCTSMMDT